MSNAIDWQTTATALAAVTGGVNGEQAAILHAAFTTPQGTGTGDIYSAAYGSPGGAVDLAKAAWLTAANALWSAANSACRYVESLSGTPAFAISFNAYDNSALVARLQAALAATKTPSLISALSAHLGAIQNWDADPQAGVSLTPLPATAPPSADPYLSPYNQGGVVVLGVLVKWPGPTVRSLEIPLNAQIVAATSFLSLAAYV